MKSNKLNLKDMWRLYLLLKPAIAERDRKDTIEDEVLEIIKLSDSKALLECVHILYDNKVKISNLQEFVSFIQNGLDRNRFFEFDDIMRGFNGLS
jgi:hypothetical protein